MDIIDTYSKALQQPYTMHPVSSLKVGKAVVAKKLIDEMLEAAKASDFEYLESLKSCFVLLATFVDDSDFEIVRIHEDAVACGVHAYTALPPHVSDRYLEISKASIGEGKNYLELLKEVLP
jgi:hypothetical protein